MSASRSTGVHKNWPSRRAESGGVFCKICREPLPECQRTNKQVNLRSIARRSGKESAPVRHRLHRQRPCSAIYQLGGDSAQREKNPWRNGGRTRSGQMRLLLYRWFSAGSSCTRRRCHRRRRLTGSPIICDQGNIIYLRLIAAPVHIMHRIFN